MATTRGPEGPVLIKKYGNRRLYDTTQSRYITLEDLAEVIKAGASVKVVEASTERDLTRQVLTQVILEQQDALDMFPLELLHSIIRVQGTLEQAPFAAFLAAATRQFVHHGALWTQQMAAFLGAFNLTPPRPGSHPRAPETVNEPPPPEDEQPRAPEDVEPPPDQPRASTTSSELQSLRQRMDALLGKLGEG